MHCDCKRRNKIEGHCEPEATGPSTVFTIGEASGAVFSSGKAPLDRYAPNIINEFAAIGIPRIKDPGYSKVSLNESLAAEFAFWYCVQAKNQSMWSGVWSEDIIEPWSEAEFHDGEYDGIPTVRFVHIPDEFNVDHREQFLVRDAGVYFLQQFFNETVRGSVDARHGNYSFTNSSTDYAHGLFASFHSMGSWTENVARSMSNQLRADAVRFADNETDRSLNPLYKGTAFSEQVIITVRWGWIVYPVIIVLTAVIYLVIEAVRTARTKNIRPWKDDPLVPLYLQLDEKLQERLGSGLGNPDGVEKVAGKDCMTVTRGDAGFPNGFKFKEN